MTRRATPSSGFDRRRVARRHGGLEFGQVRHQQAGGVKKAAAELMGISQRALSHYLAKHRLG